MPERPLSDFDTEQMRALLSIAQGDETPGSEGESGGPGVPSCSEPPARLLGGWIDQYKLTDLLGEGGMAVVYLAQQEHPIQRQVALKLIKPGMDSKRVIPRFEMERRTLARLDHPNIARILDGGTSEDGRPYFAMEYVAGLPITEYCDRNKLRIEERLDLFRQVCEGVHYAHQKGIIHRDLKASNVLVTAEGGHAVPKIIDFGIARAISPELTDGTQMTEAEQLIGTPEYMSPEQVNSANEDIDVRSDVYSLGVLLYILLTGAMPFDPERLRQGGVDTLRQIIQGEEPKTPSTRLSGLGEQTAAIAANRRTETKVLAQRLHQELEWIPLKAMAKDREQRYRSAADLADDIRNYLNGTPLIAGPPRRSYRLKKFVKRKRRVVAATLLVGLALGAGTIVSLTMYLKARVETERSQAVSGLLNNTVLSALSPMRAQGGAVTPVSVLDAVSEALEGRFRDAPLLEAGVRQKLGLTYLDYDRHRRAAEHLARAWDLRRRELGEENTLTVNSSFGLGLAEYYEGRYAEAGPLLLAGVAERTRRLGEEHDSTLFAETMLAWNYDGKEERDKAMRWYDAVLQTARRLGGDTHPRAIQAMFFLGLSHTLQGRYEEAETWLRKAIEASRVVRAEDHASTADFTGWLGLIYYLQGRYAQAEPVLAEAVRRGGRVFGESDWVTLRSLKYLICLCLFSGRSEEAQKWYAQYRAAKSAQGDRPPGRIRYDPTTGTYMIWGSGTDIWDAFDEFHFAHKLLRGDGSIAARIDGVEGTQTWTKVGIMIRKSLDATSEHASLFITPVGVVAFQRRSAEGTISLSRHGAAKAVAFPHWIRLTRQGNAFTAQHSQDGVTWEEVQSGDPARTGPIEIEMNETAYVGLAASSLDPSRTAEGRLSHVTVTGSISPEGPFVVSQDIGIESRLSSATKSRLSTAWDANETPTTRSAETGKTRFMDSELTPGEVQALTARYGGSAGGIAYEKATDSYTIRGAGKDIWSNSDQFHFAHKALTGNASIVARIDSVQNVRPWTKAGVMIRNTLAADSAYAAVVITPQHRVSLQYRPATGQNASSIHTDPNAVTLPHWVRLLREGNLFRAQHSDDGREWRDLQGTNSLGPKAKTKPWLAVAEIPMNEAAYIGLAVSSLAGPFVTAEAKMSNVAVTGKVQPLGEFLWSEDIGFQMILLPKK